LINIGGGKIDQTLVYGLFKLGPNLKGLCPFKNSPLLLFLRTFHFAITSRYSSQNCFSPVVLYNLAQSNSYKLAVVTRKAHGPVRRFSHSGRWVSPTSRGRREGRKVASGSGGEDGEGTDDDGGRGGGGQVPPPPHRHAPRQRLRRHAQGPLPSRPSLSLKSRRTPRHRPLRPKGRWFGALTRSDGEAGFCVAPLPPS
jgi:hypothetical protein